MKDYKRPEFYITDFLANEYIAACAWSAGTKLEISCGGSAKTVKLVSKAGSSYGLTQWNAQPIDADGKNVGNSETLYPAIKTKDGIQDGEAFYVYGGTIYGDPHTTINGYNNEAGEYIPGGNGVTPDSNGYNAGRIVYDCVLPNGTSANHHHLTSITNKNNS